MVPIRCWKDYKEISRIVQAAFPILLHDVRAILMLQKVAKKSIGLFTLGVI